MRWCTCGEDTFCALLRLSLHLANFAEGTTTNRQPGRAGIPPQHPAFPARRSNRADRRFLDFGRIEAMCRETEMTELAKKIAVSALLQPALAFGAGGPSVGFQPPQTIVARHICDLHTLMLGVCLMIPAVGFGGMFYSIVRFRKAPGPQAHHFPRHNT